MNAGIAERAEGYVRELCRFPDRHPGRPGNDAANGLFEREAASFGFEVSAIPLDCLDFEAGPAWLETLEGVRVDLHPGPYSLPADAEATLEAASSVEELETGGQEGAILLLHGEVAAHQLMPKRFPFYNPESHRRIIAAIESRSPAVVVAATGRDPEMVGSQYPFPLLEDGDFDIPNAYLSDREGAGLLRHVGGRVRVRVGSRRFGAKARQLMARLEGRGDARGRRVVVFGHIDSRHGTPGALDNASGVASMLVLAGLLAERPPAISVELVPLNGEDYYAASGHLAWLAANEGRFGDIALGLNADDAGHVRQRTSVSLYGCPPEVASAVRRLLAARHDRFLEGPQWPQGDHSLFVMRGIPAVAFTSEDFMGILARTAHTERDVPDLVDGATVADVAEFMSELVAGMS